MSRRFSTLLVAVVVLAVGAILALTVPVPLVALGPGPVFDTLGSVEVPEESADSAGGAQGGTDPGEGGTVTRPIVEITGAEADKTDGVLDMTTVAVRQNLRITDAITYWLDPEQDVVPRDQVFPPDQTQEQVDQQNADQMIGSENSAAAAAFHHLKLPMVPTVQGVADDGAASGVLEEGDKITSVDGAATPDSRSFVDAIAAKHPGDSVDIAFDRPNTGTDGKTTESKDAKVKLKPGDPAQGLKADQGYLGVVVGDLPANGTGVKINLADEVGGPSAGLMFALSIVDKLSPGELTGGRHIAGTGEISADGKVGPIGGIPHKISAAKDDGATTFLVPSANCAEAAANPPEGIDLVDVDSLDSAISALETIDSGGTPKLCATP